VKVLADGPGRDDFNPDALPRRPAEDVGGPEPNRQQGRFQLLWTATNGFFESAMTWAAMLCDHRWARPWICISGLRGNLPHPFDLRSSVHSVKDCPQGGQRERRSLWPNRSAAMIIIRPPCRSMPWYPRPCMRRSWIRLFGLHVIGSTQGFKTWPVVGQTSRRTSPCIATKSAKAFFVDIRLQDGFDVQAMIAGGFYECFGRCLRNGLMSDMQTLSK